MTAGTVTVSLPLRVTSSVYTPNRDVRAALNRHRYQGLAVMMLMVTKPTAVETAAMLTEPSQVFFGSANGSETWCLPNRFPMSAAAPSPLPHIRMAATAI